MNDEITDYNGFILIDKEVGITSYDVIRRFKPLLPRGTKIGHGGTLDPFASGLLILLIGKYTKRSNEIMTMKKKYEFELQFGYETDTLDPTGVIVEKQKKPPTFTYKELREGLKKFIGQIQQTPPQYSAKKVNGKPAYKYARKGEKVSLKMNEVEVYSLDLINNDIKSATFEAEVSSGTYIRTLGADIGRELGTYATTTMLRRTSIGKGKVENALKSEKITELSADKISNLLVEDI